MGGGVGRGVDAFDEDSDRLDILLVGFFGARAAREAVAGVLDLDVPHDEALYDLSEACWCTGGTVGGCRQCCCGCWYRGLALEPCITSEGADGSSLKIWEPGSARVPTFCAELVPLGKASGDVDLPLPGEGGGEPKSESLSSSSCKVVSASANIAQRRGDLEGVSEWRIR